MASKKEAPVSKKHVQDVVQKAALMEKMGASPAAEEFRLLIENVFGFKMRVPVTNATTIGTVKEFLSKMHGINRGSICIVARIGYPASHVRLDDSKTVSDYGLKNNDRLLMIPVMRSGDLDDTDTKKVHVFLEDAESDAIIDRMLRENGKHRRPDCRYVLTKAGGLKPGEYIIAEIPLAAENSGSTDSSSESKPDEASGKTEAPRQLSAAEKKANASTQATMRKLQESIAKSRKKAASLKKKDGRAGKSSKKTHGKENGLQKSDRCQQQ